MRGVTTNGVSLDVFGKSRTVLSGIRRRSMTFATAEYMPGTTAAAPASGWTVVTIWLSLATTPQSAPTSMGSAKRRFLSSSVV